MDKWSPTNLVSLDKWSLEYSTCPEGQAVGIWKYGDRIGWGSFFPGNRTLGPFVHGDQMCWGPFVQGINFKEIIQGYRKSGSGSLGIKWVWNQMHCSPVKGLWSIRLILNSFYQIPLTWWNIYSWQMRRWVLSCSYLEEKLSLLKVLAVLAVIYLETSLSPGEVKSSIQGQFPGLLLL